MANEVTTAAGSAGELVPAIVEREVIQEARAALVIAPRVRQRSLVGVPGVSVGFPIWPTVAAAAVAEGSDLANTAVNTTAVTITAAEVGVMILVKDLLAESDVLEELSENSEYAQMLGRALATKLDTDLAALFAALNSGAPVGTSGSDMTVDHFLEALYTLEAHDARGPFSCVLHPVQYGDLRNSIKGATGIAFGAEEIVRTGVVGTLFGVEVVATSVCATANSGADRVGAMFGPDAIGLVTKRPPRIELQRDASARGTELVATVAYGVGELVDTAGVPIVTDA
jgi:HK97 family phage major capsid protein